THPHRVIMFFNSEKENTIRTAAFSTRTRIDAGLSVAVGDGERRTVGDIRRSRIHDEKIVSCAMILLDRDRLIANAHGSLFSNRVRSASVSRRRATRLVPSERIISAGRGRELYVLAIS